MKKLALVATLALVGTAHAALDTKMDLRGRFDYVSDTTQANGGTKLTNGNYTPKYLRWKNAVKFNETTTAELTLNFAAASAAATSRSLSDMVDTAAVTKSLGHNLTAIIGKQPVLVGGRENDYSAKDMYNYSLFNGSISGNQIGLTGQYDIAPEQSLYIQHLESTGAATLKDKKITGAAFYGSLASGMLKPILSYHLVGTDRVHKNDVYAAAGLQCNVGTFVLEADYLMLTQKGNGIVTSGNAADAKLNSVVAHVRYNHEMYKPFVKYILETGKDGYAMDTTNLGAGVAKSERNAWEVGLEIVPNKDEDMRYHVVYNSSEMKEKTGGTDKYKEDKIIAGVAFAYNILK